MRKDYKERKYDSPKRKKDEAKNERISLRVTGETKKICQEMAKECGFSQSCILEHRVNNKKIMNDKKISL